MLIIDVESVFLPFASAAVERLRYLYPNVSFDFDAPSLSVAGLSADSEVEFRRQIAFQLYREKIYQDGLPMRTAMYAALLK